MVNYVLLSGSSSVVQELFAKVEKVVNATITFTPAWSEKFISKSGGWAYYACGNEIGDKDWRVCRTNRGVCIVNGPVLGIDGDLNRAELVGKALAFAAEKAPDELYESMSGVYNIATITLKNGLLAFSDFTGAYPNYYTVVNRGLNGSVCIVGNRCMTLAGLRDGGGEPDLNALSWLIGHSSFFGTNTPFRRVSRILNETFLTCPLGKTEVAVRPFRQTAWPSLSSDGSQEELSKDDWARILDVLSQNVKGGISYLSKPRVSITGGKDSRLVLSLAIYAFGKDGIEAFTNGVHDSPELLCAQYICSRVGVRHKANIATHVASTSDYARCWDRLKMHAYRYEGFVCPWDGACAVLKNVSYDMTGFGGELYRGPGGEAKQFKTLKYLEHRDRIYDMFYNFHQKKDPLAVQSDAVDRYQKRYFKEWLDENMKRVRYDALPEKCYVENRITNWNGPLAQNAMGRVKVMPLFSKDAARLYFRLNAAARSREQLHYSVSSLACPLLPRLPFLNQSWAQPLVSPDMERDFPFSTKQLSKPVQSWQKEFVLGQKQEIVDLLESARRNTDIEYIFDVGKLCDELKKFNETTPIVPIKIVLSAIGIAHVLTRAWKEFRDA